MQFDFCSCHHFSHASLPVEKKITGEATQQSKFFAEREKKKNYSQKTARGAGRQIGNSEKQERLNNLSFLQCPKK